MIRRVDDMRSSAGTTAVDAPKRASRRTFGIARWCALRILCGTGIAMRVMSKLAPKRSLIWPTEAGEPPSVDCGHKNYDWRNSIGRKSHFMKGTIVKCMEDLVIEKYGAGKWKESLDKAGV